MIATNALRAIYRTNLGVRKTERVLVFTDKPSPGEALTPEEALSQERLRDVALLAAETGRSFAGEIIFSEFPSRGSHGEEPPLALWELAFGARAIAALKRARVMGPILKKKATRGQLARATEVLGRNCGRAVDAVVALSRYSTSHTTFREFLTTLCGTRYASMPLFEPQMLEGAMNVDWRALALTTKAMAKVVNRCERLRFTTPEGSDITMLKAGRKALADTGILTAPGAFGNLPAGEVYFAPVEGTAEGTLVLGWAPSRKLASPVILTVKDGLVKKVRGREPYTLTLEKKLSERADNRNVAELGIGTNSRAMRPDNILESEKILGTVHLAFGDNSTFGGEVKTPFHQDFVFFRPTVTLISKDGRKSFLMKGGKLNRRLLNI